MAAPIRKPAPVSLDYIRSEVDELGPSREAILLGAESILDGEAFLVEQGCGAWHGRTACGMPAAFVLLGSSWLWFRTYRSCIRPGGPTLVAVCDQHWPWGVLNTPAKLRRALIRDMPPANRRNQAVELLKYQHLHGIAPGASDAVVFCPAGGLARGDARIVVETRDEW